MIDEFEHLTQALKYYVDKMLEENKLVKSTNEKNTETYKKYLIELHPVFFKLKNPKKVIFKHRDYRNFPFWVVSEILSEILNINPPITDKYNHKIISESYTLQANGKCEYLYGSRWSEFNQIENVYKLFKKNINTKNAVIDIHTPWDCIDTRNDRPCNLSYIFLVRDNKLDMQIISRSIDITKGFRYDFSLYSFIQQCLASWLNIEIGNLFYYCNSLHCYSDSIDAVKHLKQYLSYHDKEIEELDIDKNMDIGKTYDDLRLLLDVEVLARNGDLDLAYKKLANLNYKFSRDFGRIYILKNTGTMDKHDKIMSYIETSIKNWY